MSATIEQTEAATKTRLYSAMSVVDDWKCGRLRYSGVRMYWFVSGRQEPIAPYDQCIENYEPSVPHSEPEVALDECFTLEEVTALAEYLKSYHNEHCEIKEVELPIKENTMPTGAIPCGGTCQQHSLTGYKGYDLSFRVSGYYDVEACESVRDFGFEQRLVKHVLDELKLTADASAVERVAKGLEAGGFEIMHTAN